MEYAVSAAIVLLFICLRLVFMPKIKPYYFVPLQGNVFERDLKTTLNAMPLPRKGGSDNFLRYKFLTKWGLIVLSSKKYKGIFDGFLNKKNEIRALFKTKPQISSLPSINGDARAVVLSRFILQSSGFNFDEYKLSRVLESQNLRRTLSFCEIDAMPAAFKYVVAERVAHIFIQLKVLAKAYRISLNYLKGGVDFNHIWLKKSRLFLSICANAACYKGDISGLAQDKLNFMLSQLNAALSVLPQAENYDFTRYYTPLEILDRYHAFSSADEGTKRNFLSLLNKLSDGENIDEYIYTSRIDSYMTTASAGHSYIKRLSALNSAVILCRHKKDISMLAAALSSSYFMDLFFKPTKNKSIIKNPIIKNTFEPIYKFRTLNFGISESDGRLKLCPRLPKEVQRADIKFYCDGAVHNLHITRGDEKQLTISGMALHGTDEIRLNGKPLDITLVIPHD